MNKADRRMTVAILAMVAVFAAVVWQRDAIRARWWERNLVRTESLQERARLLALLANSEETLASARRLLAHQQAGVRSFGLVLLRHVPDADSFPLLKRAAEDPDLRTDAIRQIGGNASPKATEFLIQLTNPDRPLMVRVQAIQLLGDSGSERAEAVLQGLSSDTTVFEGLTPAEQAAKQALSTTAPGTQVDWPTSRTVGEIAADALHRLRADRIDWPDQQ